MDKLSVYVEAPNADKATADVNQFKNAVVGADKTVKSLGPPPNFGARVRQAVQEFIRGYDKAAAEIEAAQQKAAVRAAGSIQGGAKGGLFGAITGAQSLIGSVVASGVVVAGKELADLAAAAEDSKAVLSSTAKQLGVSYDELAVKAENFGSRTALANNEAQRTFAQLANFAQAAGRSDRLDEFTKRFTDLAAAKGIQAAQLGDISKQLNALTDEATDKLLNANPSAFYDAFAKSIGKTAESLSDAEKRAAVFDEVLKRGAIFDGTAAARTQSLAGSLDQLAKSFTDAGTAAGGFLGPFIKFLADSTTLAVSGKNPSGELSPFWAGLANDIIGFDRTANNDPGIFGEQNLNFETKWKAIQKQILEGFNKAKADLEAANQNPSDNLVNFALSRFAGDDFASLSPDAQRNVRENAIKKAKDVLATSSKEFAEAIKSGNRDTLNIAFSNFGQLRKVFDPAEAERLAAEFSKGADAGFRKILTTADVTVRELRKTFSTIQSDNILRSSDRAGLLRDFETAILNQVNAGRSRVEQFGKETDALFANLFQKTGAANPFVAVFSEADELINRVRISTAALTKDLQDQAAAMATTINANALFSARVDNTVNAAGLRFDASQFRKNQEKQTNDAAVRAFQRFQRDMAGGTFRNPDALRIFEASATGQTRVDLFDRRNALDRSLNFFRNPDIVAAERERLVRDTLAQSPNGRLDAQLKALQKLTPENDAQRDRINAAIIALTQGADPSTLTEAQRNAAATAREQEAARLEAAERDAKENRTRNLELQTNIDKNIGELLKIAKSDGLTGVIRIINDAEDKAVVKLGKRPTTRDAKKLNDL